MSCAFCNFCLDPPAELRWLVLDEADRLLDLGFEKKLREITELINKRQQQLEEGGGGGGGSEGRRTVLLSATLHGQLGALAELALKDPAVLGFQAKQQVGHRQTNTTTEALTSYCSTLSAYPNLQHPALGMHQRPSDDAPPDTDHS